MWGRYQRRTGDELTTSSHEEWVTVKRMEVNNVVTSYPGIAGHPYYIMKLKKKLFVVDN